MSKNFQAGPQGTRIKSDCQVFYKPGSDPLKMNIESKVDVLFSKTIRDLAETTFASLGVTTGSVEIKDFGALPFVMMAQIETVVKRAHPEIDVEVLPDFKTHAQYETSFGRFRRSRLYLPGNQPKLFLNAGIHNPDCIILDLEDSVPPGEKDSARHIVRNALRTLDFFGAERMSGSTRVSWVCRIWSLLFPTMSTPFFYPKQKQLIRSSPWRPRFNPFLKKKSSRKISTTCPF